MEQLLELLKEVNIMQIVVMFAGMWFFYNRLDNKIDRVEARLSKRIDDVEKRIDDVEARLSKRIDNLEKRIDDVEAKLTTRIDNLYNLFAGFLYNKKDDNAA